MKAIQVVTLFIAAAIAAPAQMPGNDVQKRDAKVDMNTPVIDVDRISDALYGGSWSSVKREEEA